MTTLYSSIVLSIYPNVSGLGYAVFEGALIPVDWGIKTARQKKHTTLMRHTESLLHLFKPSTIILPARSAFVHGSERLVKVAVDIEKVAMSCGAVVRWYSRTEIRQHFSHYGAQSKDAIAAAISRLLPEFEQHLPPPRKIWMSEDYRMGIFDAVALMLAHYGVGDS